jgi:hypothetical protein
MHHIVAPKGRDLLAGAAGWVATRGTASDVAKDR